MKAEGGRPDQQHRIARLIAGAHGRRFSTVGCALATARRNLI
jgi:hypothetical protein